MTGPLEDKPGLGRVGSNLGAVSDVPGPAARRILIVLDS